MASKGRKISGITIPVQLDTSNVDRDIEQLASDIGRVIDRVQKDFAGSLNSYKLAQGIVQATKAMGGLRDSVAALKRLENLSDFEVQLEGIGKELGAVATAFGGTADQQKKLIAQLAQTQAIHQEVADLKTLQRVLDTTKEATIEFVKARGINVSSSAISKFTGEVDKLKQIEDEYRNLAKLAGEAPAAKSQKAFIDTRHIKEAVDAFHQLHPAQVMTREDIKRIADAAGVSAVQVRQYVKELERANQAGRGWRGAFSPSNMTAAVQSGVSALGVVGGAYGAVELTKSMFQSSLKMENFEIAYKSIFDSASVAAEKLEYVRRVSDELGISFLDAAEGAKKLFASAKGTVVEKDVERIYESFSKMGVALKLTGSEMESVYLALSQMISKGKVSAEELRLQLAERMPGAVNLFAKAIGKTTAELDKMLQNGEVGLSELVKFADEVGRVYSKGAKEASTGLQSEIGRTQTAWFDLKRAFIDTDSSANTLRSINGVLEQLVSHSGDIKKISKEFVVMAGSGTAAAVLFKGFSTFAPTFMNLASAMAKASKEGKTLREVFKILNDNVDVFSDSVKNSAKSFGKFALVAGAIYVVYKFVTALDESQEALRNVTFSIDDYIKKMREAKAEQAGLTAVQISGVVAKAERDFTEAKKIWDAISKSSMRNVEVEGVGEYTYRTGFFADINKARPFIEDYTDKDKEVLLKDAEKFGREFIDAFNKAISEGTSTESLRSQWEGYLFISEGLKKSLLEGLDPEEYKVVSDAIDRLVGSMNGYIEKKEELDQSNSKKKEVSLGIDLTALDAGLKKLDEFSKSSKFFEEENFKESLKDQAKVLKDTLATYDLMQEAVKNNVDGSAKFSAEIEKTKGSVRNFIGKILESNVSLDEFRELIKDLPIDSFQILVNLATEFAQIDFSKNVRKFLDKADVVTATKGLSKSQRDVFDVLYTHKTKQSPSELADLIKRNEWGSIETAFGASLSAEDIKGLQDYIRNNPDKTPTPSSKKGFDFEALIRNLESARDSWRGKIQETKLFSVGNDLEKYVDKIEEAFTKNPTEKYRKQLEGLKVELEQTADAYKAYLFEKEKEKALDMYTDLSLEYGEMTSFKYEAVIKAEEAAFQKRKENADRFYENGVLSATEYYDTIKMLEELKSDHIIHASEDLVDTLRFSTDDFFKQNRNFIQGMDTVVHDSLDSMGTALANFAVSGARDIDSFGKAIAKLADDILASVAKLMANQLISGFAKLAMDALFPAKGNYGLAKANFLASHSSGSALAGSYGAAKSAFLSSHATGGVFSGGNLSSFSNTVVSAPTNFSYGVQKFARGAGLMGEAGPEAIMPLVRMPSGHLGVRSEDGTPAMSQSVTINIIDNVGVGVSQKESKDDQGNSSIDIVLDKKVAGFMSSPGSAMSRSMRSVYGAQHALANR